MEYSVFITTLRQLYKDKKINIAKIKSYYNRGIITADEYDFILCKTQ